MTAHETACLHCRIADAVEDWADEQPDGTALNEILRDLARVAGELMALFEPDAEMRGEMAGQMLLWIVEEAAKAADGMAADERAEARLQ